MTTATAPRNPWRDQRREQKAQAIARLLWRHMPPEVRTNPDLAAGVADVPQEERDSFARCAGQNPPSEETWERVCELVAEKVADERRWLSLDESQPVGEQPAQRHLRVS